MKIFFSAGEPSGDLHAANLIHRLRRSSSGLEAVGYGGPEMARAGCQLHADLTSLAVMWLARVILNLHKFLALAGRADRYFRHHRPDAVVLVDYPGFNWWIARRAKAHGIPVFYYAPPQIWAWAPWRIKKMRRYVDHVLCSLPFEATWFAERGVNARFVGHPYFDELEGQNLDAAFLARHRDDGRPLVVILPGSRTQEVVHNLRYFLAAARLVRSRVPAARFAVACFKPRHAELAREAVAKTGLDIEVFVRRTPELVHLADCCMAVSGSVSLELLYHTKPTVILYWISSLAFVLQGWFRKVKYITLVNLLAANELFRRGGTVYDPDTAPADEVLFPEYLTSRDKSPQIARRVISWLTDRPARQRLVERLANLKALVAHGGASQTAADYILDQLEQMPRPVARPHYIPSATALPPGVPVPLARHAA
ncbi:MAG TPA: lipid-A-disaccharide synthase [Pirellulales bacterium]|jgi:lipid-A-disaccharide synthase|nr:lipid-A-disaccharide synthase [Pirellulales bacterium]